MNYLSKLVVRFELVLDGRAHTLDISQLRFSRFSENDLVREHNVV